MTKVDLKSKSLEELEEIVTSLGEKKFRASQIFNSLHFHLVAEIDDIKGISKQFKQILSADYNIETIEILKRFDSQVDETKKYLFKLSDGNIIESVFMKYKHGNSICISTQVGCKMGCEFCASTKSGLIRNLTAGEILEQFYSVKRDTGEKISNIVLMGSGEPLDNFENVMRFMELLHSENGQNLSYRNMTLSTCGIVPKIYELADADIPINLAISLHNPFDEERVKIMPIAKKYKIEDIIKSCRYYIEKTGRRVTFEYTLIEGENDKALYAKKLAELLKDLNCHINLIPLNKISEYEKRKSTANSILEFKKILQESKLNVTVRRELGPDINAACGQLRIDYINKEV